LTALPGALGNGTAHVSNVTLSDLCPCVRCTTAAFAPALFADLKKGADGSHPVGTSAAGTAMIQGLGDLGISTSPAPATASARAAFALLRWKQDASPVPPPPRQEHAPSNARAGSRRKGMANDSRTRQGNIRKEGRRRGTPLPRSGRNQRAPHSTVH